MKYKYYTLKSSHPHKTRGLLKSSSTICCIFAALFLLQVGCATIPQTLPEASKSQIKTVGVVGADFEPEYKLKGFVKGRGKGLAGGVAIGAGQGLVLSLEGGPITMIFAPIFMGAGAILGGAAGIIDAMPLDKVKEIESSIKNVLEDYEPQQDLVNYILKEAQKLDHPVFIPVTEPRPTDPKVTLDYRNSVDSGIDTMLEISVIDLGFKRGETSRKHFRFFMNVQVRVIGTFSGEEILFLDRNYVSDELTFIEWTDNNALLLREEWKKCYQILSRDIVERVFVMTDLRPDSTNEYVYSGYCWLKPTYPELKLYPFSTKLKFVEIESIQPILVWDAFPREGDIAHSPEGLIERIKDITYELKIWRVEKTSPVELIYQRSGLTEPSHALEQPLEPLTRYYWTLRANYFIDGHKRMTGWSYSRKPGPLLCDDATIPYQNYFRFKTSAGYIDEKVMN